MMYSLSQKGKSMAKEPSVFWRPQAKQLQYDANMFYFNVYIQQKTIVKSARLKMALSFILRHNSFH